MRADGEFWVKSSVIIDRRRVAFGVGDERSGVCMMLIKSVMLMALACAAAPMLAAMAYVLSTGL